MFKFIKSFKAIKKLGSIAKKIGASVMRLVNMGKSGWEKISRMIDWLYRLIEILNALKAFGESAGKVVTAAKGIMPKRAAEPAMA